MSVLIYTENWDGKFKKLSHEIVSYGSQLADQLGTEAVVVSIGKVAEEELKTLGGFGASVIYNVNDDRLEVLDNKVYASIIAQVAEKAGATVVIFAHNFTGKALAPRLAVKMDAGVASAVTSLPTSLDPFKVPKGVFTGKAIGNVEINTANKVITLFQNSIEIIEKAGGASIENFSPELNDADFSTRRLEVNKVTDKVLLTDAEIVVSAGRGMKNADNWGPIEELASLLGAATACSRPVSDEGWRPHEEHVGQTGKIIAPNVYFAFGISGAIQHLGGVSSSKHIIAVNTDKDAPIFEAADYGVVGDALKVLPEMIEEIKKAKS